MELIHLPKFGLASEKATIREMLKTEGDTVAIGDDILTVETEKASIEVQSSAGGVLGRFLVSIDESIAPGSPVAVVVRAGETLDEVALARLILTSKPADAPDATPVEASPPGAKTERVARPPAVAVRASPRVRKLAAERQIDLSTIRGTGTDGLITEADLNTAAAPAVQAGTKLSGIQAAVAARMTRSWREIPHIHQIIEIEADALIDARKRLGVSMTPLLVKAAAIALKRHPAINAHFDGERVVQLNKVNIAVAIGEGETLLTPVVPDADLLSVKAIADAMEALRERMRMGKLTGQDLADGSFTVSNLGMYGIDFGTPIINPPQVSLMFVGATSVRPVLREGALAEAHFVKITLSFDHRVVSGIPAAHFSQEVRNLLQNPQWATE